MKVLITGGDGFIGRNLVHYVNNINMSIPYGYGSQIEMDIIDKKRGTDCINIDDISKYDAVVHLAALASIGECMKNIDMAIRDNVLISFKLFNAYNPNNIPIIFASSQAAKTPKANFYASCKRIIELEAKRLHDSEFKDIRCLRFTNVYGGIDYLQDKTTVVQQFITKANNGEEFVVNGNGMQTRDFIHVDDICKVIYKCMMSPEDIKHPIDIGTGIETTILDLAEMIESKFTFNYKSDMIGVIRNVANTTNAKKFYDFVYEKELIDYVKKERKKD